MISLSALYRASQALRSVKESTTIPPVVVEVKAQPENSERPEGIFDTENLGQGMEPADVFSNTAIMPRPVMLNAENWFPLGEVLPAKQIMLSAILTMAYGKRCDFPVTGKWNDREERRQQRKYRITI